MLIDETKQVVVCPAFTLLLDQHFKLVWSAWCCNDLREKVLEEVIQQEH